jgi:Putative transposase
LPGRTDDDFIRMLMGWRHTSGFSVDNGVRITRDDDEGKEALAQYILRNPFSIEKLTYNEKTGTVIYHSKMTHGKNKKNFEVFDAEEFIAAITQHIPDKGFQMARYYGWYSNRARGERAKDDQRPGEDLSLKPADIEVLDVSEYQPHRIPSKTWRECIKKVWEVDPLKCPRCQAEMKIISFITQPEIIRRILEHLKLWDDSARNGRSPPNTTPPASDHVRYEPVDDGWPGYEEPCITIE